jgi:glycosyl-4,4'-diaponeurosporenoate acyltransferase
VRIIHLPDRWTILLDFVAWAIIQPGIAFLCIQIPASAFNPDGWLFRTRPWERGGAIYQRLFRVKQWKSRLPDGAAVFRKGFSMKGVADRDPRRLRRWIAESCRAELTHWASILPALLFFTWNPFYVGVVMILYAGLVNLPCIIAQRYNRPRLKRLLR